MPWSLVQRWKMKKRNAAFLKRKERRITDPTGIVPREEVAWGFASRDSVIYNIIFFFFFMCVFLLLFAPGIWQKVHTYTYPASSVSAGSHNHPYPMDIPVFRSFFLLILLSLFTDQIYVPKDYRSFIHIFIFFSFAFFFPFIFCILYPSVYARKPLLSEPISSVYGIVSPKDSLISLNMPMTRL